MNEKIIALSDASFEQDVINLIKLSLLISGQSGVVLVNLLAPFWMKLLMNMMEKLL